MQISSISVIKTTERKAAMWLVNIYSSEAGDIALDQIMLFPGECGRFISFQYIDPVECGKFISFQ
jgi:hypothetical protein